MNAFQNLVLLQPIDGKWLPLDFRMWRAGMLTANLSMVATEAPAWAFVAYVVFGESTMAFVAACIVGMIMSAVIWTADAGIVTADMKSTRRFSMVAGTRLIFVIISVAFTARYIATFVLSADIQNEWAKRDTALVQKRRVDLFDKKIENLNRMIVEKHKELDLEVEGRLKSGVVGCGPICRQLQADVTDLNGQLDKVNGDEAELDHLATNPKANAAAIAARYGLVLPPLTMKARNEMLAELTKQPGYRATELTVRAWVFLIFIAMLLAKLAQPESATLVYRQSLRPKIAKFDAGEYDARLLPQYRSKAVPCFMTLAYLQECTDYFHANEIEQKKLDLINGVKAERTTVRGEVAESEEQVAVARRAFSESRNRRDALHDAIAGLDRSVADIEQARKGLEQATFSLQRVHEMVELTNFEQNALHQRDGLRREFEVVFGETARYEVTLHAEEQNLTAIKERMWLAEKELQTMQWSVAKAAAIEFAQLVGSGAAPEQRKAAVVSRPEPQQPQRSLADSGKAVLAGLIEGRISGVSAPASILRRTVSAYLHSKLVTISAVVALVCVVLVVTRFFAHSVLAQLH